MLAYVNAKVAISLDWVSNEHVLLQQLFLAHCFADAKIVRKMHSNQTSVKCNMHETWEFICQLWPKNACFQLPGRAVEKNDSKLAEYKYVECVVCECVPTFVWYPLTLFFFLHHQIKQIDFSVSFRSFVHINCHCFTLCRRIASQAILEWHNKYGGCLLFIFGFVFIRFLLMSYNKSTLEFTQQSSSELYHISQFAHK